MSEQKTYPLTGDQKIAIPIEIPPDMQITKPIRGEFLLGGLYRFEVECIVWDKGSSGSPPLWSPMVHHG